MQAISSPTDDVGTRVNAYRTYVKDKEYLNMELVILLRQIV
jgi:hypothetical protein